MGKRTVGEVVGEQGKRKGEAEALQVRLARAGVLLGGGRAQPDERAKVGLRGQAVERVQRAPAGHGRRGRAAGQRTHRQDMRLGELERRRPLLEPD